MKFKNITKYLIKYFIILFTSISLVSCSSYRPILYPNEKYKTVGEAVAENDADLCNKEAKEYLQASKKRRMVKEAGRSAVIGSIFGGIFGFLVGGDVRGLAVGAGIGAGTGAAFGAGSVAVEDNLTPDQVKQRYVSNCMSKQGYEVIGWE